MKRFFAFLIVLAIISSSFGPALADQPGGSPCTSMTLQQIQEKWTPVFRSDTGGGTPPFLRQNKNVERFHDSKRESSRERCVAVDTAAFVLPTADNGGCGFKAIPAQGLCHAHEPRIIRVAVRGTERALLSATLAQPDRPPKNG